MSSAAGDAESASANLTRVVANVHIHIRQATESILSMSRAIREVEASFAKAWTTKSGIRVIAGDVVPRDTAYVVSGGSDPYTVDFDRIAMELRFAIPRHLAWERAWAWEHDRLLDDLRQELATLTP